MAISHSQINCDDLPDDVNTVANRLNEDDGATQSLADIHVGDNDNSTTSSPNASYSAVIKQDRDFPVPKEGLHCLFAPVIRT